MSTIENLTLAEGTVARIISLNNQLVGVEASGRGTIDRINALNPGARTIVDEALANMGVDIADFDSKVTALTIVLDAIAAEMVLIKTQI